MRSAFSTRPVQFGVYIMNLLILRHADAEGQATSDFERKLTDKGRRQSKQVGRFLAQLEITPERIVTSPLVRAVETAELVGKEVLCNDVTEDERLACGMQPATGCELLFEYEEDATIMLVGHEPDLSTFVAYLSGMENAWGIEMKKASSAYLEVEKPGFAGSTLRWLIPPKAISI